MAGAFPFYGRAELSDLLLRLHAPGSPVEEIRAHKIVLCLHSSLLRECLIEEGVSTLDVVEREPKAFKAMLQFLYTSNYDYETENLAAVNNFEPSEAPTSHVVAFHLGKKYGVPRLCKAAIAGIDQLFSNWNKRKSVNKDRGSLSIPVRKRWWIAKLKTTVSIHYMGPYVSGDYSKSEMGVAIARAAIFPHCLSDDDLVELFALSPIFAIDVVLALRYQAKNAGRRGEILGDGDDTT
ncbi:uncharacterized protein BDZ99DRAFT_514019 [Mytilinidion resinicola]|uniref:BTB domain-containing protein n=1 Tax=Mytilinidion resinicola TaxID=574789 RepID=A0A6A6ZBW5_9PEZI|nr:uncharacterized protein BDZ99DRAFT_514019 [Mytilinidion resinicola]KAF2817805.1 hypothetical protein BDZ99DRAFT_514019 [Mytilinidion resinicola]